jgi:hypothetical protein
LRKKEPRRTALLGIRHFIFLFPYGIHLRDHRETKKFKKAGGNANFERYELDDDSIDVMPLIPVLQYVP